MGLQEKGGWNMTSVRHWLNLERGPDPHQLFLQPRFCYPIPPPLPYHPQVPPIGASALAPAGAGFGVIKGLETSDPRACLLSWAGQTCLGAGHTTGLRCLLVLCPKSHRGEGEGELGKSSALRSDFFPQLCPLWLFIYLVPGEHSRGALIFNKS